MKYINPPETAPENIIHRIFFSQVYNHELGFNIYLPPDYSTSGIRYPVSYHLHGWTGNESSEISAMEEICRNRHGITVFPNSSPVIEDRENLPVESMLTDELIPLIDKEYRTLPQRENRSISGFSMGGAFSFFCAVKRPESFSSVTAYAGTYHHFFHKGSNTVGVAPEKAVGLYEAMMREKRYLEEGNILCMINSNVKTIRDHLNIDIRVGADDVLFCENEILHLFLNSLNIPHRYTVVEGAGHELFKIV